MNGPDGREGGSDSRPGHNTTSRGDPGGGPAFRERLPGRLNDTVLNEYSEVTIK